MSNDEAKNASEELYQDLTEKLNAVQAVIDDVLGTIQISQGETNSTDISAVQECHNKLESLKQLLTQQKGKLASLCKYKSLRQLQYESYKANLREFKNMLLQQVDEVHNQLTEESTRVHNKLTTLRASEIEEAERKREEEEKEREEKRKEDAIRAANEHAIMMASVRSSRDEKRSIFEEAKRKKDQMKILKDEIKSDISKREATDITNLDSELQSIIDKMDSTLNGQLLVEVQGELNIDKYSERQKPLLQKAKKDIDNFIETIRDYCIELQKNIEVFTYTPDYLANSFLKSDFLETKSKDELLDLAKNGKVEYNKVKQELDKIRNSRNIFKSQLKLSPYDDKLMKAQYDIIQTYGDRRKTQIHTLLQRIRQILIRPDPVIVPDDDDLVRDLDKWESEISKELDKIKCNADAGASISKTIEEYQELNGKKVSNILKDLEKVSNSVLLSVPVAIRDRKDIFEKTCKQLKTELSEHLVPFQEKLDELRTALELTYKQPFEENEILKKLRDEKQKHQERLQKIATKLTTEEKQKHQERLEKIVTDLTTKEKQKHQEKLEKIVNDLQDIYRRLVASVKELLNKDYDKKYTHTKWFFVRQVQSLEEEYEQFKFLIQQLKGIFTRVVDFRRGSNYTPVLKRSINLEEEWSLDVRKLLKEKLSKTYEGLRLKLEENREITEEAILEIFREAHLHDWQANDFITDMEKYKIQRDQQVTQKRLEDENLAQHRQLELLTSKILEIKSSIPEEKKQLKEFLYTEFKSVLSCVQRQGNSKAIEEIKESLKAIDDGAVDIKQEIQKKFSIIEESLNHVHSRLNGFQKAFINFESSLIQQKIHNDITEQQLHQIGNNLETMKIETDKFMKENEITKEAVKKHIDESLSDVNKNLKDISINQEGLIKNLKDEMIRKCDEMEKKDSSSREGYIKILEDLSTTVGSVETKIGILSDEVSEIKANQINLGAAIKEMKENQVLKSDVKSIVDILGKVTDDSTSIKNAQEKLQEVFDKQNNNSSTSSSSSSSATTLDEIKSILMRSTVARNEDESEGTKDKDKASNEEILLEMKSIQSQLSYLLQQGEENKMHNEQIKDFIFNVMQGEHRLPTFITIIPKEELREKDYISKASHAANVFFNPKEWGTTKYKLFFHCSRCMRPAQCGEKGHGYRIYDKKKIKNLVPLFRITTVLLRVGLVTVGLPPITFPFGDVGGDTLDQLSEKLLDEDNVEDLEEELNHGLKGMIRDIEAQRTLSPDLIMKMKPMTSKCHSTIDHIMTELDPYRELIGLELRKGGYGVESAIEWVCPTCTEGFDAEGSNYNPLESDYKPLQNITPVSSSNSAVKGG